MGGVHPEVQRGTSSVDGAVERVPRLVDLDGGFIHAGGVMSYFELWPAALIEFRGIALGPTTSTYCCRINRDLAFPQELFHIPVASGIAQKPADCTADHLGRAKAPCEQGRQHAAPGGIVAGVWPWRGCLSAARKAAETTSPRVAL